MIKLTFLGTGTSQGVPMIACPCEVCASTDPRDKRLRTSALVQVWNDNPNGVSDCGSSSGSIGSDDSVRASAGSVGLTGKSIEAGEPLNIVIDAGPDFRMQMLTANVRRLDAILLTHEHKDHTGGIDDVRAFNYFGQTPIDIYATGQVQNAVRRDYAYAFEEYPYPGAPEIEFHTIADEPFRVEGRFEPVAGRSVEVVPIRGLHMKLPVTGFRFGKSGRLGGFAARAGGCGGDRGEAGFGDGGGGNGKRAEAEVVVGAGGLAYMTDFNYIDDSELAKLQGLDVLVVNALAHVPHISHFNLEQAIDLAQRVGARQTYFTHVAHRMGLYALIEATLPAGIHFAYDGLTVTI